MAAPGLVDALGVLRDLAAGLRLGLDAEGAAESRRLRAEIVGQLDDYLLPRLRELDAPLLAVVGGSTGAGKSTLVNTLVGAELSPAGVLRPTTRAPVLVCAPTELDWFVTPRILPGLSRVTGAAADVVDPTSLRVLPSPAVPPGLALLDAPDIDSVVAGNRVLAGQLLAAADLWIFVTTAARYADAVPWDLLHTAEQRSTALSVVLNRVPPAALDDVGAHLAGMLAEQGLSRAVLFPVPETTLVGGRIPDAVIAPLRTWLDRLAGDAGARAEVVRETLDGALRSLADRVPALARGVDAQLAAEAALRDETREAYAAAAREVDDGVRGGSVLRGEVLARWQEFVGTGQLLRTLQARVGTLRDRLAAAFTGRPAPATEVRQAVQSNVAALVRAAADGAAERTVAGWQARPAGRALLGPGTREMSRSSPEFAERLDAAVRGWQAGLLQLVADQGAERRTAARLASFGVNGAGLVLMLAVFAQTGGLTGAEVAIAGGTSAVSQKLLEAVFGDTAVRLLAAQARNDLLERVDALLAAESERFSGLLDRAVPTAAAATDLRAAQSDVQRARRAARRPVPGAGG